MMGVWLPPLLTLLLSLALETAGQGGKSLPSECPEHLESESPPHRRPDQVTVTLLVFSSCLNQTGSVGPL